MAKHEIEYPVDLYSHGHTNVGSASTRLLCMYHSCSSAKTTRPSTRTHACHLQNWLLPLNVSKSSSTPLFAKSRHMPDRIPEIDAYEEARKIGVRGLRDVYESGLVIMDEMEFEGDGDLERG